MNRFKPARQKVLAFIHGRTPAPTLVEIACHVGFDARAAAYHVDWLVRLELLARIPGVARGLVVTEAGAAALDRHPLCSCDVPCRRFTCESSLHRGSRSTPWCNGCDDGESDGKSCATCDECWVKRERAA